MFDGLSCEQDILSPHRYVTAGNHMIGTIDRTDDYRESEFIVNNGDVVADIGSADGNFSLSIIDVASHIYVFEPDNAWLEPLKHTFEKYKNKITIINKYVSDIDSEDSITLDTFFKDKKIDFVKADIEGFEYKMLLGAKNLLVNRRTTKWACCTYHKTNDAEQLQEYLRDLGYSTYFTRGLMAFGNEPPYLRKGIIRAEYRK
jgi:hypothetical protein